MSSWLIAALAGAVGAFLAYAGRRAATPLVLTAAALRALAVGLIVALALNAIAGRRRPPAPLVVLDVSASWLRGRDSADFARVREEAARLAGDSLLIFGDSLRPAHGAFAVRDRASRARSAAERAMAAGRPLILYTDGELDDPESLASLPGGSRVVLNEGAPAVDAAVVDVRAPRVAATGDSVEAQVTVAAGAGGATAGTLRLQLGARAVATLPFDSLPGHGERTVALRFVAPAGSGPLELRASIEVPGDREPANDAASTVLEITSAAAAVLVSSSPDLDSRELAALLRGTVALPTRAYVRVAPGAWRDDASLAPVSEEVVRRAVREAPLVVLHGDTALFGPPRTISRGALALVAAPAASQGEWFATGAPVSPVSRALSGTAWDSLPPLDVAATMPTDGHFEILETRRARRLDRRVAIVGWERPRRIVVAGAAGFWRWRFRGGAGGDAYTSVWGSILDWLAGERSDLRAAYPAAASVRAGDAVAWRRGASADSVVTVLLAARGASTSDTVTLRFGASNTVAESPALPPGSYDVTSPGGTSLLVVNPSREFLPRRPTVADGPLGSGRALGEAPRARDHSWLFALAVLALCAEWLLRRRIGLR